MKLCTSIGQDWARYFVTFRLVSAISRNETGITSRYLEITLSFSLDVTRGINGGYLYMAVQRHEISLRVLKNIKRVSALSNCYI